MWAVIPFKRIQQAKQRLASVLSVEERCLLSLRMLEDVLTAAVGSGVFREIIVASNCKEAISIVNNLGAHHFHTSADLGLNHAAREVAEWLSYKNIKTMCLFPADIPLVQAAEFQLAARAHVSCSEVTIIPSQNDGGTNCLILSPPDILPFCFGKDSHIKHLRQAEKLNLSHQTENFHGIAQDIDTPADLLALMAKPQQTLSQHFLEKINLRTRLYQPFR